VRRQSNRIRDAGPGRQQLNGVEQRLAVRPGIEMQMKQAVRGGMNVLENPDVGDAVSAGVGVNVEGPKQEIVIRLDREQAAGLAAAIHRFGAVEILGEMKPQFNVFHASLAKNFVYRERLRIKLEALGTNVLNHPNYAAPLICHWRWRSTPKRRGQSTSWLPFWVN
jgi:hypothetical protein